MFNVVYRRPKTDIHIWNHVQKCDNNSKIDSLKLNNKKTENIVCLYNWMCSNGNQREKKIITKLQQEHEQPSCSWENEFVETTPESTKIEKYWYSIYMCRKQKEIRDEQKTANFFTLPMFDVLRLNSLFKCYHRFYLRHFLFFFLLRLCGSSSFSHLLL